MCITILKMKTFIKILAMASALACGPLAFGHGGGGGGHAGGGHFGGGHFAGHRGFFGRGHSGVFFGADVGYWGGWGWPYYYGPDYYYPYPTYVGSDNGASYANGNQTGRGPSLQAAVQTALARKGFYHGEIDGDVGPQSHDAIVKYQASHGLAATGVIDTPLLKSLGL